MTTGDANDLTGPGVQQSRLKALMPQVMADVQAMLQADRSAVFINDEKTNELWSVIAVGGGRVKDIRFPNHLGFTGDVFTSGVAENIADVCEDPRFVPAADYKTGYRTRSLLIVPLLNKGGRPIGVIQAVNKRTGGAFTQADAERLREYAERISAEIESAMLT